MMDMFSCGCVLAEIYLQGENLFNFEQMMKYIKGEYDPS
jgi:phosphoinositide-3-kinase regulatory subunit 4